MGHNQAAGKVLNGVLGAATCGVVYLTGRRVAGQMVGIVAGVLVALWPNLIFHTAVLSSDVLATFGFVLVFWLGFLQLGRWRWVLGPIVGLLILTRPVAGILLAVLAVIWWTRSGSMSETGKRLAHVVVLALLVVSAWTIRNYVTFGQPVLIATNGGYNFWQVNHRFAAGNDTFWIGVPMDDPEYSTMWNADELTKNREGYRYGLAYLREHPQRFFELVPAKLFWLYHTDTSGLYEGVLAAPELAPSRLGELLRANGERLESLSFRYYALVGLLALVGLVVAPPGTRATVLLLILPAVLLTFFHLFFHAKDRFHLPILPFVAIVAAIGAVRLAELIVVLTRRIAHRPTATHERLV
jgi:4-amino-4-deoxy-L-arabinose transferase-like glycosyltransferase